MAKNELDGRMFVHMMSAGAQHLSQSAKQVNALNVFPVPDGDTGTNMNLTLSSGVDEMNRNASSHIGEVAGALSRGLLMGARGNSGVILSQLFRGFAKEVQDKERVTHREFAQALQHGVDTAYKAVIKPVEGTVLTVAREAAKHGKVAATRVNDVAELMEEVLQAAKKALDQTPDLLPVLKETGVVDAGGQGLVYIYEGFLAALKGDEISERQEQTESLDTLTEIAHQKSAQSHIATEAIEYGYCTEFIIQIIPEKESTCPFDEAAFREALNARGDSLLVVADDDLVKVHIHTEEPLKLIEYGLQYGDIRTAKIENMREQHRSIVEKNTAAETSDDVKRYGVVAVAIGDGIADIFRSMGADEVIAGGQTMNPSTEDIVNALSGVRAEHYIVLPNNGNIVMAAEQAGEILEKPVTVIPSKTVPQGLSAMLSFNADAGIEENRRAMMEAVEHVKSGQVTYAVRDSQVDGLSIKKGDFIGISDGKIAATHPSLLETAQQLLLGMVSDDTEIVTVFYGEETEASQVEDLERFLTERFPDVEVEVHNGGQPLYYYLFAVE